MELVLRDMYEDIHLAACRAGAAAAKSAGNGPPGLVFAFLPGTSPRGFGGWLRDNYIGMRVPGGYLADVEMKQRCSNTVRQRAYWEAYAAVLKQYRIVCQVKTVVVEP